MSTTAFQHPYTDQQHPAPAAPKKRLTAAGESDLRELIDADQTALNERLMRRGQLLAELESTDEVIAELRESIDRKRRRLSGDVISLLPTDVHVAPNAAPPFGGQGDPRQHAAAFGGPEDRISVIPPIQPCPVCGDVMLIDPQRGPIHQEPDGWVRAGEECRRRPADQTSVMPPSELSDGATV
ncbi:hypothetical protein [Microbispora sp. CA-102843]|uniref:hypothetical protein n=1 Tax=Microbispora sp. CA-102843 TaxID=3239952 RepID=UPI003D94D6D1